MVKELALSDLLLLSYGQKAIIFVIFWKITKITATFICYPIYKIPNDLEDMNLFPWPSPWHPSPTHHPMIPLGPPQ